MKADASEVERIRRRIRKVLSVLGFEDVELSVIITGPGRMKEMNVKWRGERRSARILSFPQGPSPGPVHVLGDLAINGNEVKFPDRLLVHGILHLIGYEHDTEKKHRRMREKEKEVLKALGA